MKQSIHSAKPLNRGFFMHHTFAPCPLVLVCVAYQNSATTVSVANTLFYFANPEKPNPSRLRTFMGERFKKRFLSLAKFYFARQTFINIFLLKFCYILLQIKKLS